MKKGYRGIVWVLLLALVMTLFPVSAFAEQSKPKEYSILISDTKDIREARVLSDGKELYMDAETYSAVTHYTLEQVERVYAFSRGAKKVALNTEKSTMTISPMNHEESIHVISKGDKVYFPASVLLPWMNVGCQVNRGILYIVSDKVSLWDAVNNLNYSDYLFNIYNEAGDSAWTVAGLVSMVTVDTVIHLRLDRFIPADKDLKSVFKGNSMYDYSVYKDALVHAGMQENLAAEGVEEFTDGCISINNALDNLEEYYGFDYDAAQGSLRAAIEEMGLGSELAEQAYQATERFQDLSRGLTVFETVNEYMGIYSMMKMLEFYAESDWEYREYLHWLRDQGTSNGLFDRALGKVTEVLDNKVNILYQQLTKSIIRILELLPAEAAEMIANKTKNEALKEMCSVFQSEALKSFDHSMLYTRIFYNTVIPISDGFEGMAKIGVCSKVQDHVWNLSESMLMGCEYTLEDLMKIRQGYIMALRTSKGMYSAVQSTIDVKVLGMIPVFNGEGLLDGQFQKINDKIRQLIASKDAERNDSSEGKTEMTQALVDMFPEIEYEEIIEIDLKHLDLSYIQSVLGAFGKIGKSGPTDSQAVYGIQDMVDIGYNGIETNREGMRQADGPNLKDYIPYESGEILLPGATYTQYFDIVKMDDYQRAIKEITGLSVSKKKIISCINEYQPDNCDDGKGRLLLWPNNGRGCYFGILIEDYRQKKSVLEVDYQILFYGPWMGDDELDQDLVTGQESRRATFAPNPAGAKYPFRILSNQIR